MRLETSAKKAFKSATKLFGVSPYGKDRLAPITATTLDSALDVPLGPSKTSLKNKASMEEWVKKKGGKRVIQKILIANNGMAATKSILSMRQWAYMTFGDEKAIEFVAMASREDMDANAEFIRLADTFVEVPSGSNKNNYANVDLIVKIAVEQGVDGVWPGWGHASENPKLPNSLKANGIQFIGPTGPVMAALGDKVSANILAQTAEVPSIPWSGDGITSALNSEGVIPKDVFDSACVFTVEDALKSAEKIGFPIMIKASEGGGGKGIRMAKDVEELKTNFIQVQNEVVGSPIFMMQLCSEARHLEVQIVGDEYGNAIALNGRDCSTQRRFQKIFEEGPPDVAPVDTFKEMERAAQRLTQSIGYIGAGTVEYLYNKASNKFFFLELNPRLQVEHPVTEGLTGVNLPSVQLQVAMGIPLSHIDQIREFYGKDVGGTDDIDFMKEDYNYPDNHVIAARITAENPDEGFKPTSGKIERVKFQSSPNVWGYFSVGPNGGIHEFADSQFGHLFASGSTREDARKALVLALKEIEVRGDIRSSVEYLIKLLETDDFKQNTIDTSWLDGILREKSVSVQVEDHTVVISAAVYRAHTLVKSQIAALSEALLKGQTSLQSIPSMLSFPIEITYEDVKYSFKVTSMGPDLFQIEVGDQAIEVHIREQPDKSLLCQIGADNFQLYGQEEPLGLRMRINGATVLLPTVFNPSELRSDVTGKVVRFLQQDGDQVEKDEPYVEVEAMKMIMAIKASESGQITHNLSPGSILSAGDLIASLKLKDPSKVKQIATFKGNLLTISPNPSVTPAEARGRLALVIDGYEQNFEDLLSVYLSSAELADAYDLVGELLTKFLQVEEQFDGQPDQADVIAALAKANKDAIGSIVPTLVAHSQVKYRTGVVLSLLRQLESFGTKYKSEFSSTPVPESLSNALKALSSLTSSVHGEVNLKARQIVDDYLTPPFSERLSALKSRLQAGGDLQKCAYEPDLSVSVDLLTNLWSDSSVNKAALEVYLRRVYRASNIESMEITDVNGGLQAKWTFSARPTIDGSYTVRRGYMAVLEKFDADAIRATTASAKQFLTEATGDDPTNVYSIAAMDRSDGSVEASQEVISSMSSEFKAMKVLSANVALVKAGRSPSYFNYYTHTNFQEEPAFRNMRQTFPNLLELNRLLNNHELIPMPTVGRNSKMYIGTQRDYVGRGPKPQTIFLRSISLSAETAGAVGAERVLLMAMDELERAMLDSRVGPTASSSVYLNILPDVPFKCTEDAVAEFKATMDILISKYATKLLKLRVDEIEIKLRVDDKEAGGAIPIRLKASSSTGGWLTREAYREYLDPVTIQAKEYGPIGDESEQSLIDPYPSFTAIQLKRNTARRTGSTYAYDFLGLLEVALVNTWSEYLERTKSDKSPPPSLFTSEELVLMGGTGTNTGTVTKIKRFPGENKIGMLAWVCTMKTPQYPEGRDVVVIANDVTVQSGSFGVLEDEFFFKASEYAREHGLPRVFISCNSGARIGLVDDLKPKFEVAWKDPNNPSLGFDYLYLSEDVYNSLPAGTVDATEVKGPDGSTRHRLDAIIGTFNGIGVENLRGSGLIAGETSRAYDETFTLSYVTGRSVGIGAYLNRLGQRVIQMQQGPMILTGYQALNKLLGKEVYTSLDQLGGPQIMYPNGVTHEVVADDKEGMQSVIDWLSYTPKDFNSIAPVVDQGDAPERNIDFVPSKSAYDPRHMLAGTTNADGTWLSGFFDKGSFKEYMGGWGKSVVVGRARLGGINMGVIAVETRLMEQRIPADPGNPDSREDIKPQAGQVWYPDSAYKTAQAIADFNRGENLPLIIFANWRGFSGGTRDMYGEILKFGAMIVDSLRQYKHPVFVYIPPGGELRGGAWVVIDPTINPEKMEMYADEDSRGGILEPPGICEVKYRAQDQLSTMHRIDSVLKELDDEAGNYDSVTGVDEIDRVSSDIKAREKLLQPTYLQVAHEFADLHDRAGRMKAKGVVSDVLSWKTSRKFFYYRVRRRQLEDDLKDKLVEASNGLLSYADAAAKVSLLTPEGDDKSVVEWLSDNQSSKCAELVRTTRMEYASDSVSKALAGLSTDEVMDVLSNLKN